MVTVPKYVGVVVEAALEAAVVVELDGDVVVVFDGEACCDGWLNGTPEVVFKPESVVVVVAPMGAPVLSIRFLAVIVALPEPLPKVIVAIWPLPEKVLVVMMAIFMECGEKLGLAKKIAPVAAMSPPWLTEGADNELSKLTTKSMPATPSRLLPCMVKELPVAGVMTTDAPKTSETLNRNRITAKRVHLTNRIMQPFLL